MLSTTLGADGLELLEFGIVWIGAFAALEMLGRTRGAGVVKGVIFVGVALVLLAGLSDTFSQQLARLHVLLTGLVSVVAIVALAVFLPEIRQALVRVGEGTMEAMSPQRRARGGAWTARAVSDAVRTLAQQHIGAIVVIERGTSLEAMSKNGAPIDAELSARLLETIFWPSSPLHDLAVIIRNGRIAAANVELPMPLDAGQWGALGSRHRAAIGATMDTDALVVVVSEQSGAIRLAQRGSLSAPLSPDAVEEALLAALAVGAQARGDDANGTASPLVAGPQLSSSPAAAPEER